MDSLHVVYMGERWDASWRRSQQIAWRLANLQQVETVSFVEFPLSFSSRVKVALGRGDEDALERWGHVRSRGRTWEYDRVRVITPICPLPFFRAGLLRNWNVEMAIRSVFGSLGPVRFPKSRGGRLLLWMSTPFWRPFLGRLSEDHVVYDYMGNFPGLYTAEGLEKVTGEDELELVRRANLVLSQTRAHSGKIQSMARDQVFLLPNGAEPLSEEEFAGVRSEDGAQTRIGYIGGVNDRLDFDLLEGLVQREPSWQFVFIGAAAGAPRTRALLSYPNVLHLGPLPHNEALKHLARCQVCIIPFRELELLASPIKLYDYLAVGKPVVSTPWPGLEGLEEFVAVATDVEGFRREIRRVLDEDSQAMQESRMQAARDNSWQARFDSLIALLTGEGILRAPTASRDGIHLG